MTENEDERFDLARIVVLSGWILTLLVCAGIILATLLQENPQGPLKEMAATCLGFLFGSFATIVKDFIKM
jgi:hypothetical protein